MKEPPIGSASPVSFVAADAFIDAIDQAAMMNGHNRSEYIRSIIQADVQRVGLFPEDGATTHSEIKRIRRRQRGTRRLIQQGAA